MPWELEKTRSYIVLETYQVYYTVIFISFEFIFILSRFSVSLESLNNYFIRRFLSYKFVLNRSSVLINCIMWSFNHFSTSSCFPRFSGSRFFRVQTSIFMQRTRKNASYTPPSLFYSTNKKLFYKSFVFYVRVNRWP